MYFEFHSGGHLAKLCRDQIQDGVESRSRSPVSDRSYVHDFECECKLLEVFDKIFSEIEVGFCLSFYLRNRWGIVLS